MLHAQNGTRFLFVPLAMSHDPKPPLLSSANRDAFFFCPAYRPLPGTRLLFGPVQPEPVLLASRLLTSCGAGFLTCPV